jgi:hypothetical protein
MFLNEDLLSEFLHGTQTLLNKIFPQPELITNFNINFYLAAFQTNA